MSLRAVLWPGPARSGEDLDGVVESIPSEALAGELVQDVPRCSPDDRVADVRHLLGERPFGSVEDIAVCSADRLVGLVPLQRILAEDPATRVSVVMDADPPVVASAEDVARVAWKAVRHGESSLAVVDEKGGLVGLVPPGRLIAALLRIHDQDFERLRDYLSASRSARIASRESLTDRLRHRVGWLLIGLAGAAASAWLVGGFGASIEADVRWAFFIPGVVYLADAVGTQTEAVVIRGLSVRAGVRRMLRMEALTGPVLGLALACLSVPVIWWVLDSFQIAAAVGLALIGACSVATAAAGAIPVLLSRSGLDPAFASGPLATVLQDLLSLTTYFLAVTMVTGGW